jgi:HEPN domain-containing protein
VNRRDFQELSRIRLKEAKALLDLGLWDGAYYLAGYAVECALKACIAKGTERYEFPERRKVESSHSHNLEDLVRVAGLENDRLDRVDKHPEFRKYWDTVRLWSEQSRYRRNSMEAAQSLIVAASDQLNGVLSWLKAHW